MLAYLSEIEHRTAFIKVYDVLKLTETPMRKTRESASDLEKRLDELERLVHGIIASGGGEYVEKAKKLTEIDFIKNEEQEEKLKEIGTQRLEAKKNRSKEQLEEYRRIIAENNNNHNE
jgi:hypothetical protein